MERRNFLKASGTAAAGMAAIVSPVLFRGSKALAAVCRNTPPQTSGPFYPGEANFKAEHDLTRVEGSQRAEGQVIYVRGRVLDAECRPISGANVEIWQACASGKYNHRNDPNPAKLDPNFRYWSETDTTTWGEYWFKTIIPGAYPADTDWDRPPHIHFKISKRGYHELVTQMYFKGHPLNPGDLIFKQIPERDRESVVVDFQPSPADFEPGTLTGTFDITLRSVRG